MLLFSGRIITVSSHCSMAALPGLSVYSATKSALSSWSDALRVEEAKYGVKVVKFIPGECITKNCSFNLNTYVHSIFQMLWFVILGRKDFDWYLWMNDPLILLTYLLFCSVLLSSNPAAQVTLRFGICKCAQLAARYDNTLRRRQ